LLTREQYFALERLHGLLDRRDAVDAGSLILPEDQAWLVHALAAAIVSYYRSHARSTWMPKRTRSYEAIARWAWLAGRKSTLESTKGTYRRAGLRRTLATRKEAHEQPTGRCRYVPD
jgi:hypothetical protein